MKSSNEKSQEQMVYVAPKSKVFQIQVKNSLLEGSFGDEGGAGAQGQYLYEEEGY